MQIKPSASIRQNYNEIADLCRSTGEPVYLTKNGEGDLVVMDIEAFTCREKMLKLREELLAVEEDRMVGRAGTTPDKLDSYLDSLLPRWSIEKKSQYKVIVSDRTRQMLAGYVRYNNASLEHNHVFPCMPTNDVQAYYGDDLSLFP